MLIVERLYWYAWAFGERQAFALADCLTEDATWEENIMDVTTVVPHVGRAAIVDFMTGFWRVIGGDPGTSTGIDSEDLLSNIPGTIQFSRANVPWLQMPKINPYLCREAPRPKKCLAKFMAHDPLAVDSSER